MRYLLRNEDGLYTAKVLEFPGVVSEGDSPDEAIANLDDALAATLEVMIEDSERIPDPLSEREFSGRLLLRMPPSLHERVAMLSELEGISLNRFLSDAVSYFAGVAAFASEPVVGRSTKQGAANRYFGHAPVRTRYESPDLDTAMPDLFTLWKGLTRDRQVRVLEELQGKFRPHVGAIVEVLSPDRSDENTLRVLWRNLSPEERREFDEAVSFSVAAGQ